TGHTLRTLSGHTDRVSAVAFCGVQSLASASWDHTVRLWDIASGRELRSTRGHAGEVWSVACSPDGHTLASGGYDHAVKLWDAATGHELRTIAADAGWVESVAFSPSGRVLASGGADHAVKLWDVGSGAKLHTLEGHAAFVKSVAFSRNGRLLVSGGADRAVRLWRTGDGHELRAIAAHEGWVGAVVFTPDNRNVASRGADQNIRVWDLISGRRLQNIAVGAVASGSGSIAISPDGRTLASGGASNAVKLFSLSDGSEQRSLTGHAATIEAVAFSADGHWLATGDEHGVVKLWDVTAGREARTLSGHSSWVGAVAFSPDGHLLASAGGDKSVRLWDVASGRELHTLAHAAPVTSVAFDPQASLLASSDEAAVVRLWDSERGELRRTLSGHTDLVEAVAFSPDGKLLASGSEDSTIRLWDVASGAERLRLIAFNDGSTLQITPQGYYDFQGDAAEEYLNVRVGDAVAGISAYREKFYRPDVVQLALGGQKLPATLPTLATVKAAPEVSFVDAPTQVEGAALELHVKITDRGGGVGEIRTFVNGSAVADSSGRALEVVPVSGVPARTIHLRLVPGSNAIQVIAFNSDGSMHSNPAEISVTANYRPSGGPQLHALIVGIQDFANPGFNLRYSVADATAIADLLQKRAAPLYDQVHVEQLTTQSTTTKSALEAAFTRYRSIDPGDVFVFYVASHGTVEGEDLASREYFLIPSNVSAATDEAIRRDALSEGELKQLIASIPATRKLLLLDTCHAGAMGDAMMVTTRGLEEMAAVKVLSGAVGSTVLSASTSDEEALEGQDGHGLFTWVLLQGLGGSADFRKNGYINTFDLADFVDDEVPKVAEQHFHRKQVPNLHNAGQSFRIASSR
ncbi:MAG: caspase family protein, partial [Gammaproteobacteria bacterium]|nr:caspase family protein [Gammaproteobacteria bacterium]